MAKKPKPIEFDENGEPVVCDDRPKTRQGRYQKRKAEDGACRQCGRPRENYTHLCDDCRTKATAYMRSHRDCKPWQSGGPGRRPKTAVKPRKRRKAKK